MSPSFLTLQEIPPEFPVKQKAPPEFPVKQKAPQGCAARGEEMKHDFGTSD